MSPNVWVEFDDETNMLIATDGNRSEPQYKWTYSDFEEYLNESITPSMYQFMATYVYENVTKDQLWELEGGDYSSGSLEEEAVDAYFEIPALERKKMHDQELANLQSAYNCADEKEMAAVNWMLDDTTPFDPTSPIYVEVCQYVRGLVEKFKARRERLQREIDEEEQWRGGWEENMETDQMYDHSEEI
jgi:hypothetical protein